MRVATCRCGALRAECVGEPLRNSICHCLDCKRRSGSAFAAQARFPADRVRLIGEAREWVHVGDSGNAMTFGFCPTCGTQLWFRGDIMPGAIAIPVGTFADPDFPAPDVSVWEARRCDWVAVLGDAVERFD